MVLYGNIDLDVVEEYIFFIFNVVSHRNEGLIRL